MHAALLFKFCTLKLKSKHCPGLQLEDDASRQHAGALLVVN